MPNTSVAMNDTENTESISSVRLNDVTILATGRWLRIASVRDEDWLEGNVVDDPERCIELIKHQNIKADIFTFAQKIPDISPRHEYYFEWDNVAAILVKSYADWWNNQVSTDLRKDVRRAQKRGVLVNEVEFNDDLVRGIVEIYNETPVRQGRFCRHYGKDFNTIKTETSTFLGRSTFIGAYFNGELIGFAKIVFVNNLACLLNIMSKTTHTDKRPNNAIIAKAIEICVAKACSHFTYGKYVYGKNFNSSLTKFKHRNGFEKIPIPRYYIPLTGKGKLILKLRLHHGVSPILPETIMAFLIRIRRSWNEVKYILKNSPSVD